MRENRRKTTADDANKTLNRCQEQEDADWESALTDRGVSFLKRQQKVEFEMLFVGDWLLVKSQSGFKLKRRMMKPLKAGLGLKRCSQKKSVGVSVAP